MIITPSSLIAARPTFVPRPVVRPAKRSVTGVLCVQLILSTLAYIAITAVPLNDDIELALFHSFLIFLACLHFVWLHSRHRGDVLHPHFILICLIYLYTTASAHKALETGGTYTGVFVDGSIMRTYYLSVVLGVVAIISGAWSHQYYRDVPQAATLKPLGLVDEIKVRWKLFACGLFLSLPIPLNVIANFLPVGIKSYNETATSSRVESLSNPYEVLVVVIAGIPTQLLFCAGLLFLLRDRKLLLRFCGGGLVAGAILVPLLGGFRSAVVDKAFLMAAVYHYRVRRVSLPAFAGLLICGHIFLAFMSVARTTSDPAEMIKQIGDYFFSDSGDTRSLSTKDSTELWSAQNLMVMIHFIDSGQVDISYGATLLAELGCFVPRAIWPGRPPSGGEAFADMITPGATAAGIGYGSFLLQEAYWAGGLFGVCVVMFAFGRILQWAYRRFSDMSHTDLGACMYGAFISVIAIGIRGGLVLQIKIVAMAMIPFVIFILLPPRDVTLKRQESTGRRLGPH